MTAEDKPTRVEGGGRVCSGVQDRLREPLLVGGLYALLTALLHLSVFSGGRSCTLGYNTADKHLHLWDYWWGWMSATESGASFFFSSFINYPPGISLWQGNSGFLLAFFTVPLRWATGDPVLTYNLAILSSLWLSCVGGYVLVRTLWGVRGAAFCAGALLAFNPLVSFQIEAGFVEYVNMGFAALYLLSIIKVVEGGSTRWALSSCLWFFLAMTWCWYMGLILGLLSGLWFLLRAPTVWRQLHRWSSAVSLLIWVLGVVLVAGAFSGKLRDPELSWEKAEIERSFYEASEGLERVTVVKPFGSDPLRLLDQDGEDLLGDRVPAGWMELKLLYSLNPSFAFDDPEGVLYNSNFYLFYWLVPLLLALIGLARLRDWRAAFFGLSAGFFVLLSLGPCCTVGAEIFMGTCRLMPYSLLSGLIPGVARVQFPFRFLFGALLVMVPLAGYGLQALARSRWVGPWRRGVLYLLVVSVFSLVYLDRYDLSMPCEAVPVPRFYETLGAAGGEGAVVEVPFNRDLSLRSIKLSNHVFSTYQTVHGRRRLTGHVPGFLSARRYPQEIRFNFLLDALEACSLGRCGSFPSWLEADIEGLLASGYQYIIVHEGLLSPAAYREVRRFLDDGLGEPVRDETTDDPLDVYSLHPGGRSTP